MENTVYLEHLFARIFGTSIRTIISGENEERDGENERRERRGGGRGGRGGEEA